MKRFKIFILFVDLDWFADFLRSAIGELDNMAHLLAGVYAAAVTPLGRDQEPDLEGVERLLDFLNNRGCHGALLLGTTGEGPSFDSEERNLVIKAAGKYKKKNPRFRLLAGTGTPSLSETIALTRAAFDQGFEGVVTLPPYYYRKVEEQDIFNWLGQVLEMAVPEDGYLLAYNIPPLTGVAFSPSLLSRLKGSFPDKFAGVKDSSGDPEFTPSIKNLLGDQFLLMTGNDRFFGQAMQTQAGGCITALANLYSPLLRLEWDKYHRGEEIQPIQEKIDRLRSTLDKYSPYAPTLKLLLKHRFGFTDWLVRPPLHSPSNAQAASILKDFPIVEEDLDLQAIISMIK